MNSDTQMWERIVFFATVVWVVVMVAGGLTWSWMR